MEVLKWKQAQNVNPLFTFRWYFQSMSKMENACEAFINDVPKSKSWFYFILLNENVWKHNESVNRWEGYMCLWNCFHFYSFWKVETITNILTVFKWQHFPESHHIVADKVLICELLERRIVNVFQKEIFFF